MFVKGKIHTLKYFICLLTQNVPSVVLFYITLVIPFVCKSWELLSKGRKCNPSKSRELRMCAHLHTIKDDKN